MLNLVEAVLADLGLLTRGRRPAYSINITTGESLAISAFVDADRFFQIKASEFLDLEPQYESYCKAYAEFDGFVPVPRGFRRRGMWTIMVTDGVHHSMVHSRELFSRTARQGSLRDQMYQFFGKSSREGSACAPVKANESLCIALSAFFGHGPLSSVADLWIRRFQASGGMSLPKIAQHGDFVFNNLGWTGSRLVVFDWEDYAKVSLAGLDVFTLCLSLAAEQLETLRALMTPAPSDRNEPLQRLADRLCELQHIPPQLFRELIPFYLLVFLFLKRNYGASVQERLADMLKQLTPGPELTRSASIIHKTSFDPIVAAGSLP